MQVRPFLTQTNSPSTVVCIHLPSHPAQCPCSSPNADTVDNEHQQDGEGKVGVDQVGVVTEQLLAAQNCNKMRDGHLHKLLVDYSTKQ